MPTGLPGAALARRSARLLALLLVVVQLTALSGPPLPVSAVARQPQAAQAGAPTPTPSPTIAPAVLFDLADSSLCQIAPGWLTVEGTVRLPAGQQALLQTAWYVVHPADLRTSQQYQIHGLLSDGDRFSAQLFWPGIRPDDTVVETHIGAILLDPLTMNPIMSQGASLDFFWYPWVCPAPTAVPTATPTPTTTPTTTPTATPTATPTSVPPSRNQAPVVDAGTDQQFALPRTTTALTGNVTDDGLPANGTLSQSWSVVFGPGPVTFADQHAAHTSVTFAQGGVYQLRLSATDGSLSDSDDTLVVVLPDNKPPLVDVGPDRTLDTPQILLPLQGDVRDDGLPLNTTVELQWDVVSGPGTVTFSAPDQAATIARFSAPGSYVLRLSANDGAGQNGSDTLIVTVGIPLATATPSATPTATATSTPTATPTPTINPAPTTTPGQPCVGRTSSAPPPTGVALTATLLLAPWQAAAAEDCVWRYRDGVWTGLAPPQAGWAWHLLAANPFNPQEWLLLGNTGAELPYRYEVADSQVVARGTNLSPLWHTVDGGASFQQVPIPASVSGTFRTGADYTFAGISILEWSELIPGRWYLVAYSDSRQPENTTTLYRGSGGQIVSRPSTARGYLTHIGGIGGPGDELIIAPQYPGEYGFLRYASGDADTLVQPPGPLPGWSPFSSMWQIERGTGNARSIAMATGGMVFATTDYRATQPIARPVAYQGQALTTRDGVTWFLGGRNGGVVAITDLFGTPAATVIAGTEYLSVGYGRANRGTRSTVAFRLNDDRDILVSADGLVWGRLIGPEGVSAGSLAPRLEVIGPALNVPSAEPTTTPSPTGTAGPSPTPTTTPTPQPAPVPPVSGQLAIPGWLGGPPNQANINVPTPITLTTDVTLTWGVLQLWPADRPEDVTTLATNLRGEGGATLTILDPTLLANGSYVLRLYGTNSAGETLDSGILVTITGDYKPGRVRFTETDLTIPLTGLPIRIGRTYDSLERARVGDFGYGWTLELDGVSLRADPANHVTLRLPDGTRQIFFFTPQSYGGVLGALQRPVYTPEAGAYGTLTADGCPILVVSSGRYHCFLDTATYQPSTYTYTDPYGRMYSLGANGELQAIRDLNGNTLTVTQNGITSSAGGLVVPFIRDSQGRITQITDPAGNIYRYSYETAGNLITVTVPDVGQPTKYTYDAEHLIQSIRDARGNTVATANYYPDGRLERETDALGNITRYAYNLHTRTTTTTFPDTGVQTQTFDSYGKIIDEIDPLNRNTAYRYDQNHKLVSRTDPLGNTVRYSYDANGRPTVVMNALGQVRTTTYTQYGGPLTIVDEMGNSESITYDATFLPEEIHDSIGRKGLLRFNDRGGVTQFTDANGATTSYSYDQYGNRVRITNPLGHTTVYTYDQLGRAIANTTPDGATTYTSYDALGRIKQTIDPLGNTKSYEYDANGNKTAEIDELGHRTTYTYDAANQRIRTTYPDGTTTTASYDWRGKILTQTDQAGHMRRFHYDLAGQLLWQTVADNTADAATTMYQYDAGGRKIAETDALSRTTTYEYDQVGRLLSYTDPLSRTTRYKYNAAGQRTTEINANNRITVFAYDARGRLTAITYPNGSTVKQVYDGLGNVIRQVDQVGRETQYTYDPLAQLSSVTNPLGQTTRYTYDLAGNLQGIRDANGHTTTFSYDSRRQLLRKVWPDGITTETFTYDAAGNQTHHRLADGLTNRFGYDALNRLEEVRYADGQTAHYTYSSNGLRETATDARGTIVYTYDAQNRLVKVKQPDSQVVQYGYNAVGERTLMTTPAGTIRYIYDQAGQLVEVLDPWGGKTRNTYSPTGIRLQRVLPNGVTTTYSYNMLDQLTMLTHTLGTQTLASYSYTLDATGQRRKVVEADGRAISWNYDAANRLISEVVTAQSGVLESSASWTYDAVGNRLTQTVDGQTTAYQYNALDQLTIANGIPYYYDERGNLINDGQITYTWDTRNKLTGVTSADGTQTQYRYDVDGRRVAQTVQGQTTTYLWDTASPYGDVVLERTASDTTQTSYVLGGTELLAQDRNGTISYYLHDGQHSVRTLTGPTGAATDHYTYTAFGLLREHQGTTPNSYRFTGQRFESAAGNYDLRARQYQPNIGRFLSRDEYQIELNDPSELNRYVYVADNPINSFDPTGYVGFEYGKVSTTLAGVTRTATLYGHRIGGAIGAAKGAFDALDARLISQTIRVQMTAERLLGAMTNLTVAQTTVLTEQGEQKIVVAINGAQRSPAVMNILNNVINSLRARGIDAFIADGDMHAEVAAYQRALTYTKDFISIGISNSSGPCGPSQADCAGFFNRLGITVFYLGRLLVERN